MMFPSSRCWSASLPSFRRTSLSALVSCCGVVSCPSPYFLFFLSVWTSRKCEYRSVRVLGSSPLWSVVNMCSRTVALIQQKTGIWHMMWRLLDVLMCEMILLHSSSSLNLLLKYSSFWASVKPRTSVTLSTHAGGIWLAAAGLEVIHTRAEGSRFPWMRFVSSTLTDDLCVTSDTSSLWLKSRGSLLSSRPSKMNKGLQPWASVTLDGKHRAAWEDCAAGLSPGSAPWTKAQSADPHLGSLNPRPSPEWTSAREGFSRHRASLLTMTLNTCSPQTGTRDLLVLMGSFPFLNKQHKVTAGFYRKWWANFCLHSWWIWRSKSDYKSSIIIY